MHHGLGTLGILPFSVIKHAGHKGSNFKKTDIVDSIRPYFNKKDSTARFLSHNVSAHKSTWVQYEQDKTVWNFSLTCRYSKVKFEIRMSVYKATPWTIGHWVKGNPKFLNSAIGYVNTNKYFIYLYRQFLENE